MISPPKKPKALKRHLRNHWPSALRINPFTPFNMEEEYLEQTKALVAQDFGLTQTTPLSEAELLEAIANRVAEMIESNKDLLLSYMYRLDIDEGKIHFALSPLANEPAHFALGRLILNRQKQRAITKLTYKPPKLDGWEF